MIEIDELKTGRYYRGQCATKRHSYTVMMWDGKSFQYIRQKFGSWFNDTMPHECDPEKFPGEQGFIPEEEIGP